MKLKDKLFYTMSVFMMFPMLRDDPKSTVRSSNGIFLKFMKELWSNKFDLDESCPGTLKMK